MIHNRAVEILRGDCWTYKHLHAHKHNHSIRVAFPTLSNILSLYAAGGAVAVALCRIAVYTRQAPRPAYTRLFLPAATAASLSTQLGASSVHTFAKTILHAATVAATTALSLGIAPSIGPMAAFFGTGSVEYLEQEKRRKGPRCLPGKFWKIYIKTTNHLNVRT